MRFLLPAAIALVLTAAAAISFARSAEAVAGDLAVRAAWARATPPGAKVGAAYVTIANGGGLDDRLVAAASPAAAKVTVHATAEESGVATMRPLRAPVLPAGETLVMRPGGTHLMLTGLSAPLREGDTVELALTFEKAGALTVEAIVAPMGAAAPPEQHHDHGM